MWNDQYRTCFWTLTSALLQAPQPAVHVQGQEPLTASMLAAAPPQEQKQMLGKWNSGSYRLHWAILGFTSNFLTELLSELLFSRRTFVPSDSSYAPQSCREDHRNAARDWQLRAAAHAGVSRVPPVKGKLACCFWGRWWDRFFIRSFTK